MPHASGKTTTRMEDAIDIVITIYTVRSGLLTFRVDMKMVPKSLALDAVHSVK